MRKWWLALLLVTLLPLVVYKTNDWTLIRKSSFVVFIEHPSVTVRGKVIPQRGFCSVTAIGPRALMIAEHCLSMNPLTDVFHFSENASDTAQEVIRDGEDHAIVILKKLEFHEWINYKQIPLVKGDRVFMYGSPTSIWNAASCYREGYFSGYGSVPVWRFTIFGMIVDYQKIQIFILQVAPGDSGSLIYDEKGNIVGMVSKAIGGFAGGFPLKFQLVDIQRATSLGLPEIEPTQMPVP